METGDETKINALGEEEEEETVDPLLLKTDLYDAAVANDTEKVLQFLDINVPPTYIDSKNGFTALHWAAMNGNVPIVKKLLECDASEPYHRMIERNKRAKAPIKSIPKFASQNGAIDESADEEEAGMYETKFDNQTIEDEEAEAEADEEIEKASEHSIDITKNTPLLWATYRGHLRVIWHLLNDGYSPNDLDKMGNNALHLAAAIGDLRILKVLIDDGGNANLVNHYKNLPVDMAKNKDSREMLKQAMIAGASMTEKDIVAKHEDNMRKYQRMMYNLRGAVERAGELCKSDILGSFAELAKQQEKLKDASLTLSDALVEGCDWCLDKDIITEGEDYLRKLELTQELMGDIISLQGFVPIKTQDVYLEHVTKVEKSIEACHSIGITEAQLSNALDLVSRCQIEYWLNVLLVRLKDVVTADDSNEHDMNKLKAALNKAEFLRADAKLIEDGRKFLGRLLAELGMSRAIEAIPAYKLPLPPDVIAPEGYWDERNLGKFSEETEGFPLPPPDKSDYIWLPAAAYTELGAALDRLKESCNGSEELGANPDITEKCKTTIAQVEKDYKALEAKDTSDRASALEVVKKMAKKLRAKNKKAQKEK